MRAAAYRKKIEVTVNKAPQDAIKPLDDALKTINNVLNLYGYNDFSSAFVIKICDEVIRLLYSQNAHVLDVSKIKEWLDILDQKWHEAAINRKRDYNYKAGVIKKLRTINVDNNPFSTPKWSYHLGEKEVKFEQELSPDESGFIAVKVTYKDGGLLWAIGKDCSGKEYYLNKYKVASNDENLWGQLKVGDIVKITVPACSEITDRTKRTPANLIYLS